MEKMKDQLKNLLDEETALTNRIKANSEKLAATQGLRDTLGPIFRAHPGITVGEAVEIWKQKSCSDRQRVTCAMRPWRVLPTHN